MNFKFLFKNNINDNRLMLLIPAPETGLLGINWLDKNALFNYWQSLRKFQTPSINVGNVPSETTGAGETDGALESSTIKFNGIDTGYVYDDNLSARKNRKLLKLTLKAKGIGDKADATGLISEYLASNGGAIGKDAAWLAKKSKQYGYTTDANGNRDYHRKPGNWGKALATIGGALLGGPVGGAAAYMWADLKSLIPGLKNGFFDPTSVKPAVQTQPVTEQPVVEQSAVEQPVTNPQLVTGFDPSKGVTFSGFSGDWGKRALLVYDANKNAEVWRTIAGDDNEITLDEFIAWLRANNVAGGADGKLGKGSLNALGFGSQLGLYSWMNNKPVAPVAPVAPITESEELPEDHILRRQDQQSTLTTPFYENTQPGFVPGPLNSNGSSTTGASSGGSTAVSSPFQGAESYYTDYGMEESFLDMYAKSKNVHDRYNREQLRNSPEFKNALTEFKKQYDDNGFTLGNKYTRKLVLTKELAELKKRELEWERKNPYPGGVILHDGHRREREEWRKRYAEAKAKGFMLQGGILKYQQGGQLDDQDKMLLASTLGMIGYAASQGKLMLIEEAAAQVASLALSQPESLQELASNKELVNAGILIVGLETVQKLSQPGVMKLLLSNIVNKMPKAMKGTKLNYIKELKGICPEGYEIEYFAAGGHICPRCAAKKKIEEAKCGKKMKAKKHEGGGVSAAVNEVKENMLKNKKDSTNTKQTLSKTTFNDGRDKLLLKTSPKTYDKAKHLKLIDEFRKNGYSYKGWSKAKADSLTRYNVLLGSDEDSDWSF